MLSAADKRRVHILQRVLGLLSALFSVTMLPPLAVALWYGDGGVREFLAGGCLSLLIGLLLYWPVRHERSSIGLRDGYLIVTLFWAVLGFCGSIPLYVSDSLDLSFAGALFESLSGLTTTGATVIVGLDELPHSLLFYRQFLQWLGGMGIIVLAVAILPMFGIGGMQLYRAEAPGPNKDAKLTPRIAETAKFLWYIYMALTLSCTLAYFFAGMSAFDAIGHAFSTVAIGGFSSYDASLGHFDSRIIEWIAVCFMLLSGVNFALHFLAWRGRDLRSYYRDAEFRAYAVIIASAAVITVLYLYISGGFGFWRALNSGVFHTVSIATTTGFTTGEYASWPSFLPVLLLFTSFVGGCAGSTGGGMKVIRVLLLFKQGLRELTRLVHPNAKLHVKIGSHVLPEQTQNVVWGFFAAYVGLFLLLMLLVLAAGHDQETAFSAVAATMNNLGPGLGKVGANYASMDDFSLVILTLAMLLGRLEIFTLLVLLTPAFWRK